MARAVKLGLKVEQVFLADQPACEQKIGKAKILMTLKREGGCQFILVDMPARKQKIGQTTRVAARFAAGISAMIARIKAGLIRWCYQTDR